MRRSSPPILRRDFGVDILELGFGLGGCSAEGHIEMGTLGWAGLEYGRGLKSGFIM